ncbi:GST-9 protein, partial [Aphelenchoides avenae]
MVHYKLTYFDSRAFGEVARFMFHYAGQSFEEVAIDDDEWDANLQHYRPITPYGRLPVLEVDGVQTAESMTIARHLAKQLGKSFYCNVSSSFEIIGLRKEDDLEEAKVESVADFHMDLYTSTIKFIGAKLGFYADLGDAATLHETAFLPAITRFFPVYLCKLKENGGFLSGKEFAWSVFIVADYVTTLEIVDPAVLKDYPEMVAFRDRVYGLPK